MLGWNCPLRFVIGTTTTPILGLASSAASVCVVSHKCSSSLHAVVENRIWSSGFAWFLAGRVAGYCQSRGIKAYNVTGGGTTKIYAICCSHWTLRRDWSGYYTLQTLYGWDNKGTADERDDVWYVCNNQSPERLINIQIRSL